jgi:hypothetical protein
MLYSSMAYANDGPHSSAQEYADRQAGNSESTRGVKEVDDVSVSADLGWKEPERRRRKGKGKATDMDVDSAQSSTERKEEARVRHCCLSSRFSYSPYFHPRPTEHAF